MPGQPVAQRPLAGHCVRCRRRRSSAPPAAAAGTLTLAAPRRLAPPPRPGADLPCLLQAALCSSLCKDSHLHYAADPGTYQRVGEATEVALRVLAEKVRAARLRSGCCVPACAPAGSVAICLQAVASFVLEA